MLAPLCCAALLVCMAALAQEEKQPLPKDLRSVPSLNRTFEQGMEGLNDRFTMKQRAPLTPGIDNWYGMNEAQHVFLSLKCVGKTVIAGSIEVLMTAAHTDQLSFDQLMTLDHFLVNLCPDQGLDAGGYILELAGVIELLSNDKTKIYKQEKNGILIYGLAMPARQSIQFNVLSIAFVKKNYDADGL